MEARQQNNIDNKHNLFETNEINSTRVVHKNTTNFANGGKIVVDVPVCTSQWKTFTIQEKLIKTSQ